MGAAWRSSPTSASTGSSPTGSAGTAARPDREFATKPVPAAPCRAPSERRFVFVMNELDSTVAALRSIPRRALALVDTKPAVPAEAAAHNHCADIQISPDGRFVYGSNRGHDSIPIFSVDQASGKLDLVDYAPCGGATPRNIALSPSGRLLFSANQNGDRISIFFRDAATGRLTDPGRPIATATPMCVKVVRVG
jgi:6-phosphogluconolactonase